MDFTNNSLIEDSLLQLLQQFVDGISEYELLKQLAENDHAIVIGIDDNHSLALFQKHFRLFHVLYALRDRCWQTEIAHIEISPLRIRVLPYVPGPTHSLAEEDSLRSYYADLKLLETTTSSDVDHLIGSFWVQLGNQEGRQQALAVLDLEDPVDLPAIKARYRRLAMQHHPDRGGDRCELQRINAAMKVLENSNAR
jgi:DnaJ-domain-containing protein 1